ncbi:YkvA family protein [Neoaquamicrobium sediminum]|uniref:YkvA family protein n=1 Tax=Neoaquamicrobium sediminum TaxID=1849104 RepID=UPI0028A910A2|nr:YkvA family protein [Mesorhizobium sediminum]
MSAIDRLKRWAAAVKVDVVALWLAARDPRVPWTAKLLAGAVAAYALSPIDIIPDFIPVLGYLDDLIIVPIGIVLATKLIPDDLLLELRRAAAGRIRPVSRAGIVIVIAVWLAAAGIGLWLVWPMTGITRRLD